MAETFESVAKKFRRLGRRDWLRARWARELSTGAAKAAVDEARRLAPERTGALRASLKATARKTGDGVELAITSDRPYARIHEEGGTLKNRTGGTVTFRERRFMRGGLEQASDKTEKAPLDVIEREVL